MPAALRWVVAVFRACLLAAVVGCTLLVPAPAAAAPADFWLGPSFEGLPLDVDTRGGFYDYGPCDPPPGSDGGCASALQVQNSTACERNPVAIDIAPNRIFRVRGGAIAALYSRDRVDVTTGRQAVAVFSLDRRAIRAVRALRRRSEPAPPRRLPRPVFPRAVREELVRVIVARRRYPTVRSIVRATGVPAWRVRVRLRIARLVGRGALRGVRPPARSWRAVQRDRQAALQANEFGERRTAREFRVTRRELRRMIRRVRGLAGRC